MTNGSRVRPVDASNDLIQVSTNSRIFKTSVCEKTFM